MIQFDLQIIHSGDTTDFVYLALDTLEGSECFGHWIWECGLFLPFVSEIEKQVGKPIKLLLRSQKKFKDIILRDFGFGADRIDYCDNLIQIGDDWQEKCVHPLHNNYSIIRPPFFFVWQTYKSKLFYRCLARFRDHYGCNKPTVKSIPVLFIPRTSRENYTLNKRGFVNDEEVRSMLQRNCCHILDLDNITSFQDQIRMVLSAKTIIVEFGSAFTVNCCLMGHDSHVLVFNDYYDLQNSDVSFIQIMRLLLGASGITYDVLSRQTDAKADFTLDIADLEKRITRSRSKCVICNGELDELAAFPKFPMMAVSYPKIKDVFYNKRIGCCRTCFCAQLIDLVDPAILYSTLYMNATMSPGWMHHHRCFANFLLECTGTEDTFLEVGANKGTLYKLLLDKRPALQYAVLDMYHDSALPTEIKFIQGNCETYDFTGHNNVILSHVFEHLYEPRLFVEQLRSAKVKNLFIAIPNFERLLEKGSLEMINSQHTFYCGLDHINYLLGTHGYRSRRVLTYDGPVESYMIHYSFDLIEKIAMPRCDYFALYELYVGKVGRLHSLTIPPGTYICPSGLYGQYLYYFMNKAARANVIGFLDNNMARHEVLLYGTDKLVYHPDKVSLSKDNTIIVCSCPYTGELLEGLRARFGSEVKYIIINE